MVVVPWRLRAGVTIVVVCGVVVDGVGVVSSVSVGGEDCGAFSDIVRVDQGDFLFVDLENKIKIRVDLGRRDFERFRFCQYFWIIYNRLRFMENTKRRLKAMQYLSNNSNSCNRW